MSLLDSNNEPSEVQLKKLMKNVLIDVKKKAKIAKMNLKKIQENDLKLQKLYIQSATSKPIYKYIK